MSLQNLNNPSGGGSGGSGLSSVSADAPLSGSGTSGSHLVIANASGAAVGVIQLTGDFGGTATAPTVVGLSHVTNGTLPASGIAAVNPSSLTGTGTVPIGGIPTGSSSSTVAIGNDSRLSDSRTPTAHATGHLTGGSDVVSVYGGHMPNPTAAAGAGRIEVAWGGPFISSGTVSTGVAFFSEFTAPATVTLQNLQIYMNTAAVVGGGSITLAQMFLCSVSGTTYSSIATTANDSTILTAGGLTSKAITGGSGAITKDSRYAIGIVSVYASLTTSPTALGIGVVQGFTNKTGWPALSGQASSSSASVAGTTTYTAVATARYFWFGATN